jgi:hypothetical protein
MLGQEIVEEMVGVRIATRRRDGRRPLAGSAAHFPLRHRYHLRTTPFTGWDPKWAAASPAKVNLMFEKVTVFPPVISIWTVEFAPNGGG